MIYSRWNIRKYVNKIIGHVTDSIKSVHVPDFVTDSIRWAHVLDFQLK
jgi:hypothetical protein